MKMGKLFSSIAAATMVLTTLAPAAVANAATGYPVTSDGVSQTPGNTLPAATDKTANTSGGSATATSDASVNVIDGYLILQSVPNFGFGAAIAGSTANLVNYKNSGKTANDGSESGLLTILDSRHSAGKNTDPMDGMGFNLSVKLGQFTGSSSTGTRDKFVLNFKKDGTDLAETGNNHQLRIKPVSVIENANASASDNGVTLLNEPTGTTGGTHNWQFNGNDVSLNIPSGVSEGQWYSTMTWTLGAAAK